MLLHHPPGFRIQPEGREAVAEKDVASGMAGASASGGEGADIFRGGGMRKDLASRIYQLNRCDDALVSVSRHRGYRRDADSLLVYI